MKLPYHQILCSLSNFPSSLGIPWTEEGIKKEDWSVCFVFDHYFPSETLYICLFLYAGVLEVLLVWLNSLGSHESNSLLLHRLLDHPQVPQTCPHSFFSQSCLSLSNLYTGYDPNSLGSCIKADIWESTSFPPSN